MGQLPSMQEQIPMPDAGTMAAMREWGFIFGATINEFPENVFIKYQLPNGDGPDEYGSLYNYRVRPFDLDLKQGRTWRLVQLSTARRSPVWAFVAPDNKIYFKILGYRRTLYEHYETIACQPIPYPSKT